MEVSEVVYFDDYFRDQRFAKKKPVAAGTWRQRCGDNIYFLEGDTWRQLNSPHHFTTEHLRQDTKYPYVFISEKFFYFGESCIPLPLGLRGLIWPKQGCKKNNDWDTVTEFLSWLQSNYTPGQLGLPLDRESVGDCCETQ
jgi:hypothetical protein